MSKPAGKLTEEKKPFIPYVEEEDFPNELMEILTPYKKRMGFIPNALKLYMHRPEISKALWTLNNNVMRDPTSTLDQELKRKLAATASKINGCTYCTSHHCSVLQNDDDGEAEGWGLDDAELNELLKDPKPKNEFEKACFDYVQSASSNPNQVPDGVHENLKKHLTPAQIIELACVVGFWKMYNTIHDSLNIPLETHLLEISGYVDL